MNTKYLETLTTVVETGGYQKAAEKLSYSVSTVTYHIRQLETELGIRLFVPDGRGVRPTESGIKAAEQARRVLGAVSGFYEVPESGPVYSGPCKIAFAQSLLLYRLEPAVDALVDEYPNLKVESTLTDCGTAMRLLRGRLVDCSMHFDIGSDYDDSVETVSLGDFSVALVGSPRLPADELDFSTPHQSKSFPLVSYAAKGFLQNGLDNYLTDRSIEFSGSLFVEDVECAKSCALRGVGPAYLPRIAVEDELAERRLIELPTEMEAQTIKAVFACRSRLLDFPVIRTLRKLAQEYARPA